MVDLHDQKFQWKCEGNQIILMGDLNEHILSKKNITFFYYLGMRELIIERHGKKAQKIKAATKADNPLMESGVRSESTSQQEAIYHSTRAHPWTTDSYG